jgi:hypothetical protein
MQHISRDKRGGPGASASRIDATREPESLERGVGRTSNRSKRAQKHEDPAEGGRAGVPLTLPRCRLA